VKRNSSKHNTPENIWFAQRNPLWCRRKCICAANEFQCPACKRTVCKRKSGY
jgi:hypothetical protein